MEGQMLIKKPAPSKFLSEWLEKESLSEREGAA